VTVISRPVLLDTGPLVALLNPHDQHHEACSEQARRITGAVFTSWAVVTEAAWLLRGLPNGLARLMQAIDEHKIGCLHLDIQSHHWLAKMATQYSSLVPQLADLSLLYLAEQHGIDHIFTLDRRDFSVFRKTSGELLELLPATF
jgi:predicted nucleic acid-binding protein